MKFIVSISIQAVNSVITVRLSFVMIIIAFIRLTACCQTNKNNLTVNNSNL